MKRDVSLWMAVLVPIAAVSSGMRVLIPLYLLAIGGTAVEVGIAFAISNALGMLASLVWGKAVDRYHNERVFIIFSFAGSLATFWMLFSYSSIFITYLAYGLYGITSAAAGPAMNLLLMGKRKKPSIGSSLARYNMFAVAGFLIAYIAGTATGYFGNYGYLAVMAFLNLAGLLLSFVIPIPDDGFKYDARKEALQEAAISSRQYWQARAPVARVAPPGKLGKMPARKRRAMYLLIASMVLFNLGFYIFYTPYIPFLKDNGIGSGSIFLIGLMGVAGQAVVYLYLLNRKRRWNATNDYLMSVVYRAASFIVIALSAAFSALAFLVINLFSNFVYGFSYGTYNMSSSFKLYDDIRGPSAGYYVSVWIMLTNLTSIVGALIGGYLGAISYEAALLLGAALSILAGAILVGRRF